MAFFSLRKSLWITFLLRVFISSWLLAGGSVGAQIFLLTFLQTLTRYLSIKKEKGSQTGSCGLCPFSKVWRECSIEGKCRIPSSCCHFGELQQLEKCPLADPSAQPHLLFCPLWPLLRQQGSTCPAISRIRGAGCLCPVCTLRGGAWSWQQLKVEQKRLSAVSISRWEGGGESSSLAGLGKRSPSRRASPGRALCKHS